MSLPCGDFSAQNVSCGAPCTEAPGMTLLTPAQKQTHSTLLADDECKLDYGAVTQNLSYDCAFVCDDNVWASLPTPMTIDFTLTSPRSVVLMAHLSNVVLDAPDANIAFRIVVNSATVAETNMGAASSSDRRGVSFRRCREHSFLESRPKQAKAESKATTRVQ